MTPGLWFIPAYPLLGALLLVSACVSPALAAYPFEGYWAAEPRICVDTPDRETDNIPIHISRRSVETFASSCRIRSIRRSRGAWRLRTICRDEGQDGTEPRTAVTFILRMTGDRLMLRSGSEPAESLVRCPR
jgi:hypothetical protein